MRAVSLRKKWKTKLEAKLNDPSTSTDVDKKETFYFVRDVVDFMGTEVSYNVKRLLPADLKDIYSHECHIFDTEKWDERNVNPFDRDYAMTKNSKLGGVNVTENVVYGCLLQEEWACVVEDEISSTPFECGRCGKTELGVSVFGIMQHESGCGKVVKEEIVEGGGKSEEGRAVVKPNSKLYRCEVCGRDLYLTPIDILKHKKTCKGSAG